MTGQLKGQMVTFLTREEIATLVDDLAQQIESDYAGKEVIFIMPFAWINAHHCRSYEKSRFASAS